MTRAAVDPGFVVVLEAEEDLPRWGFPLPDEVLARLLERVLWDEPIAVAVDKYRDRPVEPQVIERIELD